MKEPVLKVADEELNCDGLRIRFKRAGSGPTLVLVHGLLGYSFSWRSAIPILARNWEVFAPDMPGAGFSECRPDLDCRLRAGAQRLVAFLDGVGVASCGLVGSSYGGATTILLAGLAPHKVRSLILVSPANPWSKNGRKRLAALRNPVVASLFPRIARSARPLHSYFVKRMWGDASRITQDTLDGYSRPLIRPGVFEHSVKIVSNWKADMAELQKILPTLANIPTLLVWGDRDQVVDPGSAELMKQHLPNGQIAMIPGAGHLPYEECPEEFCAVVQQFLWSQTPGASVVPHDK